MAVDIYAETTNKIIAALEAGNVPWQRPWNPDACGGPAAPVNGVTGHVYQGANFLILAMNPAAFMSSDPRYCTYKQAQDAGWNVRRGEKATPIVFYKPLSVDNEKYDPLRADSPATRMIGMLRIFHVFHLASQIEGAPAYVPPTLEECPWLRPEAVQVIADNFGIPIRIGGERAFYDPQNNFIQMPPDAAFHGPEYESATLLHELGHASGHASRLDRDLTGRKGSTAYAFEEGIVDISAAMSCSALGLPVDYTNHAAYIEHWLPALREDKKLIFRIAAEAQKVSTYLLNFHPEYAQAMSPTLADTLERPAPAPEALIV